METKSLLFVSAGVIVRSPHSLGTLIEWKLVRLDLIELELINQSSPHSLGTLIEWKLMYYSFVLQVRIQGPHSLGTLIEWKHRLPLLL